MDNTGTIDPSTGDATETSQPTSSSGSEPVASESSQGQETNAGGEQSFSEGGKDNGTDTRRPQFKSKNQTIYELRQKLRERDSYWETEMGTVKQQLAEFQKMFRGKDQKPSRTFWEAPEEVLDERMQNHLSAMEERLAQRWEEKQTETQTAQQLRQEASEAAKLIKSQKGITDDDIMEIRDILSSDPVARRMADSPMEQAEYVLYKWQKEKGVTDKSSLKAKAASVQGAPPQAGGGKVWTESEMEMTVNKLGDPKTWTEKEKAEFSKLEREFMSAYSEGRVRKNK